jgi:hypothetical protein
MARPYFIAGGFHAALAPTVFCRRAVAKAKTALSVGSALHEAMERRGLFFA